MGLRHKLLGWGISFWNSCCNCRSPVWNSKTILKQLGHICMKYFHFAVDFRLLDHRPRFVLFFSTIDGLGQTLSADVLRVCHVSGRETMCHQRAWALKQVLDPSIGISGTPQDIPVHHHPVLLLHLTSFVVAITQFCYCREVFLLPMKWSVPDIFVHCLFLCVQVGGFNFDPILW
jgi:hypothetical protein